MALGKFMARPQFYGTKFGRAWAHVFWFGFLLFFIPLLTMLITYVSHHKNPQVRNAGKYQVIGMVGITVTIGFLTLAAMLAGNEALTGYDGDARKGVFAIWLLFIALLALTNLFLLMIRQLRQAKRF